MTLKSERFLTFLLDDHLCALRVSDVKEINHIFRSEVCDPPQLQIRDEAIPYFDLRSRLGFQNIPLSQTSRTLVLRTQTGVTSTTVDAVHAVIDLYPDQWEPISTEMRPFSNPSVIKGIATHKNQTVLLLDLGHITLSSDLSVKAS